MKKENALEGIYRRNTKGFGFVKVEGLEEEIYIPKENADIHINTSTPGAYLFI